MKGTFYYTTLRAYTHQAKVGKKAEKIKENIRDRFRPV